MVTLWCSTLVSGGRIGEGPQRGGSPRSPGAEAFTVTREKLFHFSYTKLLSLFSGRDFTRIGWMPWSVEALAMPSATIEIRTTPGLARSHRSLPWPDDAREGPAPANRT